MSDGLPGRPRSLTVKSGQQRTAEWRERQRQFVEALRERFKHCSDASLARYSVFLVATDPDTAKGCFLELGRRMGWL